MELVNFFLSAQPYSTNCGMALNYSSGIDLIVSVPAITTLRLKSYLITTGPERVPDDKTASAPELQIVMMAAITIPAEESFRTFSLKQIPQIIALVFLLKQA